MDPGCLYSGLPIPGCPLQFEIVPNPISKYHCRAVSAHVSRWVQTQSNIINTIGYTSPFYPPVEAFTNKDKSEFWCDSSPGLLDDCFYLVTRAADLEYYNLFLLAPRTLRAHTVCVCDKQYIRYCRKPFKNLRAVEQTQGYGVHYEQESYPEISPLPLKSRTWYTSETCYVPPRIGTIKSTPYSSELTLQNGETPWWYFPQVKEVMPADCCDYVAQYTQVPKCSNALKTSWKAANILAVHAEQTSSTVVQNQAEGNLDTQSLKSSEALSDNTFILKLPSSVGRSELEKELKGRIFAPVNTNLKPEHPAPEQILPCPSTKLDYHGQTFVPRQEWVPCERSVLDQCMAGITLNRRI